MQNTSFTISGPRWILIHPGGYQGSVTVKMVDGDGVWLGEAFNGSVDNALFLAPFDMISLPGDTEIYALVANTLRYPTARVTVTRNILNYIPSTSSAAALIVDREFIPTLANPTAEQIYNAGVDGLTTQYDFTGIKGDYAMLYCNIPPRAVQINADLTVAGNAIEFTVQSQNASLLEPPYVKITVDAGTRFAKLIPFKSEKLTLNIKAQTPSNFSQNAFAIWTNFSIRKGAVPNERYFFTDYYSENVLFNPEYSLPMKARVSIPDPVMTNTYAQNKKFGQLPNSGRRMTANLMLRTQPSSTGGTATVAFYGLDGMDFIPLGSASVAIPATGSGATLTPFTFNFFWPFGTVRIVQTCTNSACLPIIVTGYTEDI